MYKDYKALLRFMLDECLLIEKVKKEGITFKQLTENEIIKRALVKSLENIGEAGSKIPLEQREKWNNIPWKNVVGIRIKLAHDYWGINYEIVWDVIQHKIPELRENIEKVLMN